MIYKSKYAKYKQQGEIGFFDKHFDLAKMSDMGDLLERINAVIDFEFFRPELEEAILPKERITNAGAKRYDPVLLFKIMVLQRIYGLSDRNVEYQIIDRTSFKNFLGLSSGDKVPDEKTIWLFREELTKKKLVDKLFKMFHDYISEQGYILGNGKIVDASFAEAPKQHNKRDENLDIRAGFGDELWDDNYNKKIHKDIDARWTEKNGEKHFGYKLHAKVDSKSKLIDKYEVSDASVHDSQMLSSLLEENDAGQELYADSAYIGEKQEEAISRVGMINRVHERGARNRKLTSEQYRSNYYKSKIRARVEHIFGFMEQSMRGIKIRCIGIKRTRCILGLMALVYNMCRIEQIKRLYEGKSSPASV
jgi:IS5 family transposase